MADIKLYNGRSSFGTSFQVFPPNHHKAKLESTYIHLSFYLRTVSKVCKFPFHFTYAHTNIGDQEKDNEDGGDCGDGAGTSHPLQLDLEDMLCANPCQRTGWS